MRSKDALRLRIQELCTDRSITLNRLASICGITQSTLNNINSGRNNSTTISTVQKICDGLGMDLPTFFDSDLFRGLEQEIFWNLGKLWLNWQELAAKDFGSAEGSENGGILYVFPVFRTARMGQKIRCPAEDDLFRGSLAGP